MNNCKLLFWICMTMSAVSMQASYYHSALRVISKSSKYLAQQAAKAQEVLVVRTKKLQDTCKVNKNENNATTERFFRDQVSMPGVAQAAKTESEQAATASGFLNFAKNSTTTSNNNTYNYNFAKKTWHETFAEWVKNGGQTRATGMGAGVGFVGGYGLHDAITPGQKAKIVVVAQSEKN